MAYNITYSLGTIVVNDSTLNNQTSLNLPGRNYSGYGEPINQDLVNLLQNFASANEPSGAIPGQLWFNTTTKTLTINTSNTATPTWSSLVASSSNTNVELSNVTVDGTLTTSTITTGGASIPGSITGNWTLTPGSRFNATYADLAERFESDSEYDAGTVVELGGDKEVTISKQDLSSRVFGVISDTAGYLMNSGAGDDKTHPPVAMTGRVKVKVLGKVKKGDRLVSAGNGFARAAIGDEATPFNTLGRSLEDKNSDGEGKVLSAVSVKL